MRTPREWQYAFVAYVLVAGAASAQERPSAGEVTATTVSMRKAAVREAGPPASMRVDVSRVFIPVTVTDQNDNIIEDLPKENFKLFEDGVERQISEFFKDEAPVSLGIVLDSSNSMRDKFEISKEAIGSLLRLCPPGDDYFLVTVQDRPELASEFSTRPEDIETRMEAVTPKGWTALYDGIYLAIQHLRRGLNQQRALLVLSDGGDNNSRYVESEIRELVRESEVRIFSVSVLGHSQSMERFSEDSGGRAFQAHHVSDLSDLAVRVSSLIHGEYVLGFSPASRSRDGKYHNIKIQVMPPKDGTRLHSTWRHGYYAPIQ